MTRKVFENGDVITPEALNAFIQKLGDVVVPASREIALGNTDADFIVVHLHVPPPFDPTFTIGSTPLDGSIVLFVQRPTELSVDLIPVILGGTTFSIMAGGRLLVKYTAGIWVVLDYCDGRARRVMPSSIIPESLASESVTSYAIAARAVGSTELDYGSVSQMHLADNSVGTNEVIDRSITEDKLENESVTNLKLAEAAVDTYNLKNKSVTAEKIDASFFLNPTSTGSRSASGLPPVHRRLYALSGELVSPFQVVNAPDAGVVIYVFAGSSTTNDAWPIEFNDIEGSMITRSIPYGSTVAMMSYDLGWLCIGGA